MVSMISLTIVFNGPVIIEGAVIGGVIAGACLTGAVVCLVAKALPEDFRKEIKRVVVEEIVRPVIQEAVRPVIQKVIETAKRCVRAIFAFLRGLFTPDESKSSASRRQPEAAAA